jgi:uncharacterized coiled-coil protein SlyX
MPQMKTDFIDIEEQLSTVLLQAAEDQITEANNLLASTKVLVEGIKAQVAEQKKLIEEFNGRMQTFGGTVLEAHKTYINGAKHENPSP